MQEVHNTKEVENMWSAEWGYRAVFGGLSSASAGVSILFNKNFDFQIVRQFSDPEGRFVLCDIKIDNKILTLLNIYAPNEDKPVFFENIYNNLVSFECVEIILGGDFNLVLDVVNDKAGGNKTTHQKSLKQLESIKENLDLIDIWRIQHPETKRFTWRRRKPDIQCRLDFFLISSSLCTNTLETDILPGYKTDHSLITLSISTKSNPRGASFWKLNTSLLSDLDYVKSIKKTVQKVSKQYESDNEVDEVLLWEMIKMQIRADFISFAKQKRFKQKNQETFLEAKISELQKMIDKNETIHGMNEPIEELEKLKQKLEQIIEYKTKGSIIRSKARWFNEGEKNTKYFLNLEKRHCNKKQSRV